MKRNSPKPWIIGETGFSASNEADSFYARYYHGTENDQANFANFCLNEIRNAGSSGMAWWQFQDVHWGFWPNIPFLYRENWMGLIRRGNPSSGNYNALRKPAASHFQNFSPGNIGAFDQTLDSKYYDPYDFQTLNPNGYGAHSGTVVSSDLGPLQDAVIKALNWFKTITPLPGQPGNVEQIGEYIYTFSDVVGNYTFYPFNNVTPNDSNSYRIIALQCSAIGHSRIDSYSPDNTALSSSVGNFILNRADFAHTTSSINLVGVTLDADFNGYNYLNLIDANVLPYNSPINIKAGREINIKSEFNSNSETGVEAHFFIENENAECVDFSQIRDSNPLNVQQDNRLKNNFKDIEIQFKKTGRQIIEAFVQPNPSDGIVYLNILENTNQVPIKIQVFNTLGQCLKTYETIETTLLLDGIQWNKGIYFVAIKNENQMITKKVIIN
jgi:hypothetical protein